MANEGSGEFILLEGQNRVLIDPGLPPQQEEDLSGQLFSKRSSVLEHSSHSSGTVAIDESLNSKDSSYSLFATFSRTGTEFFS